MDCVLLQERVCWTACGRGMACINGRCVSMVVHDLSAEGDGASASPSPSSSNAAGSPPADVPPQVFSKLARFCLCCVACRGLPI